MKPMVVFMVLRRAVCTLQDHCVRKESCTHALEHIFKQLIDLVVQVAQRGFCNIDSKPSNFIVEESGILRMADFDANLFFYTDGVCWRASALAMLLMYGTHLKRSKPAKLVRRCFVSMARQIVDSLVREGGKRALAPALLRVNAPYGRSETIGLVGDARVAKELELTASAYFFSDKLPSEQTGGTLFQSGEWKANRPLVPQLVAYVLSD